MDRLEHLYILLHAPVHLVRLVGQDLGKRARVEQLKHRTVALPHLDHVVGNSRGHAQDQRKLCHLALMLDVSKRVGIVVNLDDIVLVDAVDRAVCAAADLLASLHIDDAIGLFHRHHLGEAGHIQDLIDLGVDVDDAQIRIFLFQPQYHTQTRAGDILQLLRIQHDGCCTFRRQLGEDLLLDLRSVIGVNTAGKGDRCHSIYIRHTVTPAYR